MGWFYLTLKLIHVFSAIVAVGSNLTYGLWHALAARQPAHRGFTLKGLKLLDDRIANPAYGVLLITGVVLVFAGNWRFTSLWIIVALVLFVVIAGIGFVVFAPLLRKQIQLVEAGQTDSPDFAALSRRSRILGPIVGVLVIVILAMMVFKPVL